MFDLLTFLSICYLRFLLYNVLFCRTAYRVSLKLHASEIPSKRGTISSHSMKHAGSSFTENAGIVTRNHRPIASECPFSSFLFKLHKPSVGSAGTNDANSANQEIAFSSFNVKSLTFRREVIQPGCPSNHGACILRRRLRL